MVTIVLEVINKNVPWQGFYNPAIPQCKKGCRSLETFKPALKKIIKFATSQDWIDQFQVKVFEGQYEHYKDCKIIGELNQEALMNYVTERN